MRAIKGMDITVTGVVWLGYLNSYRFPPVSPNYRSSPCFHASLPITAVLLLFLLLVCSGLDVCEGRRGRHWKHRKGTVTSLVKKKGKGKAIGGSHNNHHAKPSPIPSPSPSPSPSHDSIYNVLDFGAKGDGETDDTKVAEKWQMQAFEATWAEACKVEASTVMVPSGYAFLIAPISFSGPYCQPNIVFQFEQFLDAGDDCVSVQTGCSTVKIHSVNCGPGHGISIGGLGRDNTKACVSNITVQDVSMYGTMTGVRIKTFSKPQVKDRNQVDPT